jgi:hypothetical protein
MRPLLPKPFNSIGQADGGKCIGSFFMPQHPPILPICNLFTLGYLLGTIFAVTERCTGAAGKDEWKPT